MPKTKKQYQKKTHKIKQKLNKHKNNINKNKNKNNKTKKQTISFAQKQKAMKLLKQAIKKHIINIINAHKKQHQHKIRGGCKQCGGGEGNNNNGNVNNQGNIFTRLWESFRKVIQRILRSMGFSRQESEANATRISRKVHQEAMNTQNESSRATKHVGHFSELFAHEFMHFADERISERSREQNIKRDKELLSRKTLQSI